MIQPKLRNYKIYVAATGLVGLPIAVIPGFLIPF